MHGWLFRFGSGSGFSSGLQAVVVGSLGILQAQLKRPRCMQGGAQRNPKRDKKKSRIQSRNTGGGVCYTPGAGRQGYEAACTATAITANPPG